MSSLKKRQRAAARADQAPAIGHVRQALMNVLSRHTAEVCPTDYRLAEDFVYHYAAAVYTEKEHRQDPRTRVFMGAWSSHHRHRPGCDCRSRMRRSPVSHRVTEKCLRQIKRRRKALVELGIFVISKRSEKGGLLKAIGRHRARGNSHAMWVGSEVEAEIMRLQRANRGAAPPDPVGIPTLENTERHLEQPAVAAAPAAFKAHGLLTRFLTPEGRRRVSPRAPVAQLHGPTCTCESCCQRWLWPAGPDPPSNG